MVGGGNIFWQTIEINTVKRNQSILCFNRGKLSQSYCFAFNISVAKNFSKFHGNYLWWSHFLVKVQTLGKQEIGQWILSQGIIHLVRTQSLPKN